MTVYIFVKKILQKFDVFQSAFQQNGIESGVSQFEAQQQSNWKGKQR